MNRIFLGFVMLLAALMTVGCRQHKTISDRELSQIIADILVTNTYVTRNHILTDSLDIYTPVFQKYGYTIDDFKYTMENFARRKSMKLGDIVNEAVKKLEKERKIYEDRLTVIDSVNDKSQRFFAQKIDSINRITVRKISDTSKLRLKLPCVEGVYNLSFRYTIDSTDTNYGLRSIFCFVDSLDKRREVGSQWISSRTSRRIKTTAYIDGGAKDLFVYLVRYGDKISTPSLTIDSVEIVHQPFVEDAVKRYTDSMLKFKLSVEQFRSDTLVLGPMVVNLKR